MYRKIRVGAVSYLNTKPLLYGIEHSAMIDKIELKIDYPSSIASMLLNDDIDMGLVPVSIIPKLKDYYLNTDYCIGSDGAVASVCLFSEVPINEVEKVLLDYQSSTSVQLTKVLLKEYWKVDPVLEDTNQEFTKYIGGTTAGLVIGDRALEQRKKSKYSYDLGEAWKNFTELPFVFAAWISNKNLDKKFVDEFNQANEYGLQNLDMVLKENDCQIFDLQKYFTEYISYFFDERKKKGLELFLKKL